MRAEFAEGQCHILVDFSKSFRDQEYCVVGAKGAGAVGEGGSDIDLVVDRVKGPVLTRTMYANGKRVLDVECTSNTPGLGTSVGVPITLWIAREQKDDHSRFYFSYIPFGAAFDLNYLLVLCVVLSYYYVNLRRVYHESGQNERSRRIL